MVSVLSDPMKLFVLPLLLFGTPASSSERANGFDLEHVELALTYFAEPDAQILQRIAESRATEHLLTHSQRTGYYSPETSALELTKILLARPAPTEEALTTVASLVNIVKTNQERQIACVNEALMYLPTGVSFANPLFVTWGYDIGVAMDGAASINLAHEHFAEDPGEVWFYAIHEMHHAGLTTYHPMTKVSEISTTRELFSFLTYSTFLEGTATYAAYNARKRHGALSNDPDYVALTDKVRMNGLRARYLEIYERMKSTPNRPLQESDWLALETLSGGDRLWYRVGAEMAAALDAHLGREKFKATLVEGPEAFFDAYFSLEARE